MESDSYRKKIKKPTPWTREEALLHTAAVCARCEQCEADLREKIRRHALTGADADYVIDYLYEHKFLDEDRFASSYTRDKLRFNGWGRIKIKMMLRSKRISSIAIDKALADIDSDEYYKILLRLVRSASRALQLNTSEDRHKLTRRLYGRGFEPSLTGMAIEDVLAED